MLSNWIRCNAEENMDDEIAYEIQHVEHKCFLNESFCFGKLDNKEKKSKVKTTTNEMMRYDDSVYMCAQLPVIDVSREYASQNTSVLHSTMVYAYLVYA